MEDKIKILMTTDTLGGVWTYSLELCKALEEYNVQVYLVAMGRWPSEAQQQKVSRLKNVLLYKSDYKMEWMQDPWEDVKQANKWINTIYHTVLPDIIHLNNYSPIRKQWEVPVITVFHSCVVTWWEAVKGEKAPSKLEKYKQLVKTALNNSDVVISPTRAILEKAIQTHHITTKTKVIPNGRGIGQYQINEKENFILCTGRIWDEAKNLNILCSIAEKLPWPILVAGNNINPDTGKEVVLKNVHFLGNLHPEQVLQLMLRASIFVSPTKYEPFGLAILEAAKAGCALALSDINTLKEIWGDNAAYFDPDNVEEVEKTILELIENNVYRENLSVNSKKRAESYTAQKMGSDYMFLYQHLINTKIVNQINQSV